MSRRLASTALNPGAPDASKRDVVDFHHRTPINHLALAQPPRARRRVMARIPGEYRPRYDHKRGAPAPPTDRRSAARTPFSADSWNSA
jgi:hypothetical protein